MVVERWAESVLIAIRVSDAAVIGVARSMGGAGERAFNSGATAVTVRVCFRT
jgi:hypothetical protein